jgi:hypothetical protein
MFFFNVYFATLFIVVLHCKVKDKLPMFLLFNYIFDKCVSGGVVVSLLFLTLLQVS